MIIFVHIPKTAGTTLKYILRNNFGIRHIDAGKVKQPIYSKRDIDFARKFFPRARAISGHNLIDPGQNLLVPYSRLITVLRDPIKRCASHYQDFMLRGKGGVSFEEWIHKEEHQNLSVKTIAGSDNPEKAMKLLSTTYLFVGLTEYFNESLQLLNILLEEPLQLQYRRMITASSNRIKDQLLSDPVALDLLNHYNHSDQLMYDYALNEIFLPLLGQHKDRLLHMTKPEVIKSPFNSMRYKTSVGYNKYIYRQAIKLSGR